MACDAHFEVVNVCEEEADEAEGNDPLADGTGDVEPIILHRIRC